MSPALPPPRVFDTSTLAPLASSLRTPAAIPYFLGLQLDWSAPVGQVVPTTQACPMLSTAVAPPYKSRYVAYCTAPVGFSFMAKALPPVVMYAPGVASNVESADPAIYAFPALSTAMLPAAAPTICAE